MELGPNQLKFVEALECQHYKQGRNCLLKNELFCCLGVACEIFGAKKTTCDDYVLFDGEKLGLPKSIVDILKFRGPYGELLKPISLYSDAYVNLVDLNDFSGLDFCDIAKYIRANPENVFTESA